MKDIFSLKIEELVSQIKDSQLTSVEICKKEPAGAADVQVEGHRTCVACALCGSSLLRGVLLFFWGVRSCRSLRGVWRARMVVCVPPNPTRSALSTTRGGPCVRGALLTRGGPCGTRRRGCRSPWRRPCPCRPPRPWPRPGPGPPRRRRSCPWCGCGPT